ncbi:MAG: DNA-binding protein WhiA [Firmicutes bacterium]|nr:DNA-binding protein WhiA [Bacillota bacterium]
MSFSSITKNELARIQGNGDCCKRAELAALVKMDGTLHINGNQMSLDIKNFNAAVARKAFSLVKELFDIGAQVMVRRKVRLRKNNIYLVRVPAAEKKTEIMSALGIMDGEGLLQERVPGPLLRRDCCRRAYLRGLFLGGGSVSSPERAYHLEIITNNLRHAKDILRILKRFKLSGGINARKNWYVVYLKESEQIAECLNIMGAHNALLEFEGKRVYKDVRNKVNRLVNCETANLDKTVAAAVRQVEDIKLIIRCKGLDKLPTSLRQTAEARLQFPDANLRELGEVMVPPVGKSGVNHRLRKLSEIAGRLRGGEEVEF